MDITLEGLRNLLYCDQAEISRQCFDTVPFERFSLGFKNQHIEFRSGDLYLTFFPSYPWNELEFNPSISGKETDEGNVRASESPLSHKFGYLISQLALQRRGRTYRGVRPYTGYVSSDESKIHSQKAGKLKSRVLEFEPNAGLQRCPRLMRAMTYAAWVRDSPMVDTYTIDVYVGSSMTDIMSFAEAMGEKECGQSAKRYESTLMGQARKHAAQMVLRSLMTLSEYTGSQRVTVSAAMKLVAIATRLDSSLNQDLRRDLSALFDTGAPTEPVAPRVRTSKDDTYVHSFAPMVRQELQKKLTEIRRKAAVMIAPSAKQVLPVGLTKYFRLYSLSDIDPKEIEKLEAICASFKAGTIITDDFSGLSNNAKAALVYAVRQLRHEIIVQTAARTVSLMHRKGLVQSEVSVSDILQGGALPIQDAAAIVTGIGSQTTSNGRPMMTLRPDISFIDQKNDNRWTIVEIKTTNAGKGAPEFRAKIAEARNQYNDLRVAIMRISSGAVTIKLHHLVVSGYGAESEDMPIEFETDLPGLAPLITVPDSFRQCFRLENRIKQSVGAEIINASIQNHQLVERTQVIIPRFIRERVNAAYEDMQSRVYSKEQQELFTTQLADACSSLDESHLFDEFSRENVIRLRRDVENDLKGQESNYVPRLRPKASFHLPPILGCFERNMEVHRDDELLKRVVDWSALGSDEPSNFLSRLTAMLKTLESDAPMNDQFYNRTMKKRELTRTEVNQMSKLKPIFKEGLLFDLVILGNRCVYLPDRFYSDNEFGREAHILHKAHAGIRSAKGLEPYHYLEYETAKSWFPLMLQCIDLLSERVQSVDPLLKFEFETIWQLISQSLLETGSKRDSANFAGGIKGLLLKTARTRAGQWLMRQILMYHSIGSELAKRANVRGTSFVTGWATNAFALLGPGTRADDTTSRPCIFISKVACREIRACLPAMKLATPSRYYRIAQSAPDMPKTMTLVAEDQLEGMNDDEELLCLSDWMRYDMNEANLRMNAAVRGLMTIIGMHSRTSMMTERLLIDRVGIAAMVSSGPSSVLTRLLKPGPQIYMNMTAEKSQYVRHFRRKAIQRPKSVLDAFIISKYLRFVERCVEMRITTGEAMSITKERGRSSRKEAVEDVSQFIFGKQRFKSPALFSDEDYTSFQDALDDMYAYHLSSRELGSIEHSLRKAHETGIVMEQKYEQEKPSLVEERFLSEPEDVVKRLIARIEKKSLFFYNELAIDTASSAFVERYFDSNTDSVNGVLASSNVFSRPLASSDLMTTRSNARSGDIRGLSRGSNFESIMRLLIAVDPSITEGEAISLLGQLIESGGNSGLRSVDDLDAIARKVDASEFNLHYEDIQRFEFWVRRQFGEDREIYIQNLITKLLNHCVEAPYEKLCKMLPEEFITKTDRIPKMEEQVHSLYKEKINREVLRKISRSISEYSAQIQTLELEMAEEDLDAEGVARRKMMIEKLTKTVISLRRLESEAKAAEGFLCYLNGDCQKWSLSDLVEVLQRFHYSITGGKRSQMNDMIMFSFLSMKKKTLKFDRAVISLIAKGGLTKMRDEVRAVVDRVRIGANIMTEYQIEVGWPQGIYNRASSAKAVAGMAFAQKVFARCAESFATAIRGLRHSDDLNDMLLSSSLSAAIVYYKCLTGANLCLNTKHSPDKFTIHAHIREFISDYFAEGVNCTSFQKFITTLGSNLDGDSFDADVSIVIAKVQKLIETGYPATNTAIFTAVSYWMLLRFYAAAPGSRNSPTPSETAVIDVKREAKADRGVIGSSLFQENPKAEDDAEPSGHDAKLAMIKPRIRELYQRPVQAVGLIPLTPEYQVLMPSELNMARLMKFHTGKVEKLLVAIADHSEDPMSDEFSITFMHNRLYTPSRIANVIRALGQPDEPPVAIKQLMTEGLHTFKLPRDPQRKLMVLCGRMYSSSMRKAYAAKGDSATLRRYPVIAAGKVWTCAGKTGLCTMQEAISHYDSLPRVRDSLESIIPSHVCDLLYAASKLSGIRDIRVDAESYDHRFWRWRKRRVLSSKVPAIVNECSDILLHHVVGTERYIREGYNNSLGSMIEEDSAKLGIDSTTPRNVASMICSMTHKALKSEHLARTACEFLTLEGYLWAVGKYNMSWDSVVISLENLNVGAETESTVVDSACALYNYIIAAAMKLSASHPSVDIVSLMRQFIVSNLDIKQAFERMTALSPRLFDDIANAEMSVGDKASLIAMIELCIKGATGIRTERACGAIKRCCVTIPTRDGSEASFGLYLNGMSVTFHINRAAGRERTVVFGEPHISRDCFKIDLGAMQRSVNAKSHCLPTRDALISMLKRDFRRAYARDLVSTLAFRTATRGLACILEDGTVTDAGSMPAAGLDTIVMLARRTADQSKDSLGISVANRVISIGGDSGVYYVPSLQAMDGTCVSVMGLITSGGYGDYRLLPVFSTPHHPVNCAAEYSPACANPYEVSFSDHVSPSSLHSISIVKSESFANIEDVDRLKTLLTDIRDAILKKEQAARGISLANIFSRKKPAAGSSSSTRHDYTDIDMAAREAMLKTAYSRRNEGDDETSIEDVLVGGLMEDEGAGDEIPKHLKYMERVAKHDFREAAVMRAAVCLLRSYKRTEIYAQATFIVHIAESSANLRIGGSGPTNVSSGCIEAYTRACAAILSNEERAYKKSGESRPRFIAGDSALSNTVLNNEIDAFGELLRKIIADVVESRLTESLTSASELPVSFREIFHFIQEEKGLDSLNTVFQTDEDE